MREEGDLMTSIPQVAEALQRILTEEADQLAREVGFMQRERALSGADFVQTLLLGWLQEPEIAYDGLTQVLGRREVSITASGLSQRFTPEAAALLRRVLERLGAEQLQGEAVDIPLLKQFTAGSLGGRFHLVMPDGQGEVLRACGGRASGSSSGRWWERPGGCRCASSLNVCPSRWPTSAAHTSGRSPRPTGAPPMRRCSTWQTGPSC